MAEKKLTVYQKLQKVLATGSVQSLSSSNSYNIHQPHQTNDVVDIARSPQEKEFKVLQAKQQKLMARQWYRAQQDINNQSLAGLNDVRLMYRDVDLMDTMPEIGAAMDLVSEECCYVDDSGSLIHISSGSERVKGILQDLFVNRLCINTTLPMIARNTIKYGNDFHLLHTDAQLGVLGWKELPVYEIERYENGMEYPYTHSYQVQGKNVDEQIDETRFVWVGQGQSTEYRNWQICHFRLLYDSSMLPYGVSYLHKARRHFRMLSMMEDMMFIYRLDRSIERRVFKINVGAIDEADVPAYVQQIADNFKRTPIIDPMTGQIDLRKNIMPVWKKTPIPLLDGRTITIEDLAKEYENGKVNYVYSVQDETKQIVPGKVVWCGKNYTAKQMIKITLDDDTYMVMAPEHEIIMRDGTKKRADKVVEGESVMPFYRDEQPLATKLKSEYETVYNPNSGKYEFTHRLVGKSLPKQEDETVIHHKDFNRKNNSPENLQWMTWNGHKDLHISLNNNPIIQQKRSETKTKLWSEEGNREKYCQNMTVNFDDYVWKSIENAIIEGVAYSQKMIVDFINENLIDYLIKTNKSDKIKHNRKISKITVKSRVQSLGYKNCDEYINAIEEKYHLESHFNKLNKDKSERAKKYNLIENLGENVWFTDKADKAKEKLSNSLRSHSFELSEEIWNDVNQNIIRKVIFYGKDIVDFLNAKYINELNNTNNKQFTNKIVERLIKRKGFDSITEYINAIKKNHKIKSVEYIDGDDVYCMTVVGLNGEEDRHNFALQTFIDDDTYSNNGCFVSNCQTNDYFIPVREDSSSTPIENLPAGQNLTAMDDIKYVQNKIVTALRVPKTFLNFEEAAGDGKNLSLLDVRFMRTVNRIQQALLLELNKVATIHLLMLGFTDELTNFTLSMANPSSQAEMLELENLAKKVTTAKDATTDGGGGIPLASMTWAWRHIFKWSDKEIQQNLEELRLETALAAELQQTNQIIKRTRLFDPVDNIYGEVGAEYGSGGQQGEGQDDGMGGGAGGGGGMPMGGDMDFGDEGEGMDMGDEGEMDMGAAADENAAMGGAEPPAGGDESGGAPNLGEMITRQMKKKINEQKEKMYSKSEGKKLIAESKKRQDSIMEKYMSLITKDKETTNSKAEIYDRAFFMNEEMNDMINNIGKIKKEQLVD